LFSAIEKNGGTVYNCGVISTSLIPLGEPYLAFSRMDDKNKS